VLIGKALVEIPPKFAGKPPVNPKSRAEMARGGKWNGKGAQGLAEDVRHYGQWMRDEAEKRIGHLYPKATLADGSEATVIAWLWARTVRSPDPAAKGAMVPLVSSFMLSTKDGKKAWVEVVIDAKSPDGWRFEVKSGLLDAAREKRLKDGTVKRSGGGTCVLSGTAMPFAYLRSEANSGRFGDRLMAHGGARLPRPEAPEGEISHWPGRTNVVEYGMKTFASLFTPRQLVALTTFSDLVGEAREKALTDARSAGLPSAARLAEGGSGAEAYADAVASYLAFLYQSSVGLREYNRYVVDR
jgi:putative DNA methylase